MTQTQEKFDAIHDAGEYSQTDEHPMSDEASGISQTTEATAKHAENSKSVEDIKTSGAAAGRAADRIPVNFQYKSRLFEMIFSQPEELLELYNAVNGSHYTDPTMLEVNTLKNVLYMSMHNDISFILDMHLSLYEHQSTYNPSLPLRFLEYIADLYSGITRDENLYGRRLIQIPAPRFIIFYNGREKQPDRKILKLSDMFTVKEEHPSLELEAVMLNINRGHNPELMQMCKTLADYAEYTDRVRTYAEVMSIEEAVGTAVSECIKENILASFLSLNKAEAIKVSIYEYDAEKHMRQEKQESYAEGHAEGITEGLEKGRAEGLAEGIAEGERRGEEKGAAYMLYTLAEEGLLSIETAAKKAGLSESLFREKMNEFLAAGMHADT